MVQSQQKRALLIGINEYQFIGDLKYAEADANAFAQTLKTSYGFDESEVVLLTHSSHHFPTQKLIERHLSQLRGTQFDFKFLLVGFWGHGFVGRDGVRYLCAMDTDDKHLEKTGIAFETVRSSLIQAGSQNTCLILDCCQDCVEGRGAQGSVDAEHSTCTLEEELTFSRNAARDIQTKRDEKGFESSRLSNFAILNSCSAGQRAYEWEMRGHGVFTAHLLDGMKRHLTSISQLASYVSEHVPKTASTLLFHEQTPFFKLEGGGDIVLPTVAEREELSAGYSEFREERDRLMAEMRAMQEQLKALQQGQASQPAETVTNSATKSVVTVPDDFTDPVEALKQVPSGGRLQFAPGKYHLLQPLEITQDITVVSTTGNPKDVTLEAEYGAAIVLKAKNARIQGLTLQNQAAESLDDPSPDSCALYIPEGTSKVIRCEITGKARGVQVTGAGTNPSVTNCKVHDCGRAGVWVYGGASGTFTDCEMYANTYAGMQVRDAGSNPKVERCKMYDSKEGTGVLVHGGGGGTFTECEMYANTGAGMAVSDAGSNPTAERCKMYDGKNVGVYAWKVVVAHSKTTP